MLHDLSGDRITTDCPMAASHWAATTEAALAHAATCPAHLAATLASDPHFALAHAVRGLMLLSLARGELTGPARQCLAEARAAAAGRSITRREEDYLTALAFWLEDKPGRAAASLEAILADHPLDALALKLAHGIRFMIGDQEAMLATLEQYADGFADDHPFAGFVAGCHAFALEERGFYRRAERVGRRAVALAPRDAWGRHAVAHVLEMTGRADEGAAWLADASAWAHAANLRFHIVWHLALFHLEKGDVTQVLSLYDASIRAEETDDFRDIANAASLLARLEFEGVDVGGRWAELADKAGRRIDDRRLVFADLHYALALLGAGRTDDAERIALNLLTDRGAAAGHERRVAAESGAAAAFGLLALWEGNAPEAARLLAHARPGLVAIGGSHAQRDLFEQAYIESLIRSGDDEGARLALNDRLARRGGHNRYAARRLARLSGTRPSTRLAALAVTAFRPAIAH